MQPFIDSQAATEAFAATIRAPADFQPTCADVVRLCKDMNEKAALFSAWVPETAEGTAAKLRCAAGGMERGPFVDGDWLAEAAREIACDLNNGELTPALAHRLRSLLADCEQGALAFYCNHGVSSGAADETIGHIRTGLKGVTAPRVVI